VAGAASCGSLAAQSSSTSTSSTSTSTSTSSQRRGSHASSSSASGWRGSCRALVARGTWQHGCSHLPVTDLQPVLGSLEQLQVLCGAVWMARSCLCMPPHSGHCVR
jgi:hypothetical protein